MILPLMFYLVLGAQGAISFIFHLNWLKKSFKIPKLLMIAYSFGFIWYALSTVEKLEKIKPSTNLNLTELNTIGSLTLVISLVCSTYFILTLRPVLIEKSEDKRYFYAFPVHLLGFTLLIFVTFLLDQLLNFFIS
jgi:hypothetical protein